MYVVGIDELLRVSDVAEVWLALLVLVCCHGSNYGDEVLTCPANSLWRGPGVFESYPGDDLQCQQPRVPSVGCDESAVTTIRVLSNKCTIL